GSTVTAPAYGLLMRFDPEPALAGWARTDRDRRWAATMHGRASTNSLRLAHRDTGLRLIAPRALTRQARAESEVAELAAGAAIARGAGNRAVAEPPDPFRTCFERDRDRILHSMAFRRLAGKTQVFLFPDDHQRTRLTHALEVGQVATSIARAIG